MSLYGETPSGKQGEKERQIAARNEAVEKHGWHWCPNCYDRTGIKRPLGIFNRRILCPVCDYSRPEGALDPNASRIPDEIKDRIAP